MEKQEPNFGQPIPELKNLLSKYGVALSASPAYVLVGQYNSKEIGTVMGILAAANNEFHAHLLRREIRKSGLCDIEQSEYHPSGNTTFSIEIYKRKMREKFEKLQKQKKETV